MLSAVPSTLPPLVSVAVDPEDAQAVCRSRKKTPTSTSSATPTSRATPTATTQASKTSKKKKTSTASKPAASRTSASGYARTTSSSRTSAGASKKAGPLAFLDDPKLSMEEKLLKLLGYLNDKWNKELDQKMKEFKQTSTSTSSSRSGGSSGIGGLAKKALGFASSAVPQLGVTLAALRDPTLRSVLKNVAGPALAAVATAVGQPELAPVALKYGPDLVDAAAGAASYASSGGTTSSGSSTRTTTTTKETADGIGSDKDAQLKLMEMQRILDQQKEMFSMVSNMLRTTHDTRMAIIQNVR